MATGVGRGRICLASFNSPTTKTPVIRKDLWDISYTPCPGKNGPPKQNAVKCTVYNTIQ